jgi:hypothetical protein
MVAVISGADNGSLFMPFGVPTFSRPFAILSFYRKQRAILSILHEICGQLKEYIDPFTGEPVTKGK